MHGIGSCRLVVISQDGGRLSIHVLKFNFVSAG